MRFDFSDFHPLDHHALNPVCARYPGGFRRHVRYWASYQVDVLAPWHKIKCLRNKHDWTPFWNSKGGMLPEFDPETKKVATPPSGQLCRWCWEEISD